ncbi:MAG: alkaline phosphatase family protein [Gemmatimonadota bacterium]
MRAIAAIRAVAAISAIGATGASAVPAQAQEKPDLVVLLAVDQLRADYLDRFGPQFTGGLKRLMEQGAFLTNAYQDHAVTETAVGHAAMLSGRFPRSFGIVSNTLGVPDPQTRMLNGGQGASPFRFRGSTLIDWLRVRSPASRALAVSVKDRSAILPLGRAKQHAFWYSPDGTFTTSSYYADTLPAWLRSFNARQVTAKYAGMEWWPLMDARFYPEPDTVAREGTTAVFPHKASSDVAQALEVLADFPWMDEVLLELALTGLDSMQLGKTGSADLLSISLSTTDLIGHRYGPDSREVHDQILRLDRALGAFLDALYARFSPEQIAIVMTADHGVSSFPELVAEDSADAAAHHVDITPALTPLRTMLEARGLAAAAVTFGSGMLRFDEARIGYDHALMDTLAAVFAAHARRVPGVARVDFVRDLARGDTINDAITRRWHHMIPRDLPIPVVVTLEEDHVFGLPRSATHGSPHDADAHVPIIFFGPQFKPGRYTAFARTVDIAPTLAAILDIHPTEPLDGKVLTRVLK